MPLTSCAQQTCTINITEYSISIIFNVPSFISCSYNLGDCLLSHSDHSQSTILYHLMTTLVKRKYCLSVRSSVNLYAIDLYLFQWFSFIAFRKFIIQSHSCCMLLLKDDCGTVFLQQKCSYICSIHLKVYIIHHIKPSSIFIVGLLFVYQKLLEAGICDVSYFEVH